MKKSSLLRAHGSSQRATSDGGPLDGRVQGQCRYHMARAREHMKDLSKLTFIEDPLLSLPTSLLIHSSHKWINPFMGAEP